MITYDGQAENVILFYVMYLYNAGNQYVDITGGWTGEGWQSDYYQTRNVVFNSDHIYFKAGKTEKYSHVCIVGTGKMVDLSNIDTLKANVEITTQGSVSMYICETNSHTSFKASVEKTTVGTHEYEMDVSSYNGSYYIMFFSIGSDSAGWHPEAKIKSVWGE